MAHALLMLYLFTRKVGELGPYHIGRTTLLSLAASIVMALSIAGTLFVLRDIVPAGSFGSLIRVLAASGVGGVVYLLLLRSMGLEELALLRQVLRRRSR